MRYCIQLFGNVWGIPSLDEERRRSVSFTKTDNNKLQVLQNKVLRLKTGLDRDTPTVQLLKSTSDMSVHQMTAYHTLTTVHKVVRSQYPRYLADRLKLRQPVNDEIFPWRQLNTRNVPNGTLSLTRSGFMVRAASLWNWLPSEMRSMTKFGPFKRKLRKWVLEQVLTKPP